MNSRRAHDGSRYSKRGVKPDSGTKDEGEHGYNHTRAASGVLIRSQSVNRQSWEAKMVEIVNIETSYYHSASGYSRALRG